MKTTHQRVYLLLLLCLSVNFIAAQSTDYESYYKKGKAAYYDGNYKTAQSLLKEALTAAQSAADIDAPYLIKIINRLARTTTKLRQNQVALDYYELAQKIIEENGFADSIEMAANWKNRGIVYLQMYKPDEAIAVYEKALNAYKKLEGQESSPVGNVLMDMGGSFQKMGDYDKAEQYYLKAFAIFKKSSKPDSEDFNRIYSNMGYLYRKKGDCQQALEFGQKALEIKLKNYKPEHPSVAKYHRNIGKAIDCLGNLSEAIPHFEKALNILRNSIGSDHPQTAGSLGELADLYHSDGKSEKAIQMFLEARKVLEKTLEPDHPYMVANYFNSAIVHAEQKNFAAAERNLKLALPLLENRSYPPRTLIAMTHTNLADLHRQQSRLDSALLHCRLGIQKLTGFYDDSKEGYYTQLPLDSIPSKVELLKLLRLQSLIAETNFSKTKRLKDLQFTYQSTLFTVQLIEKMRSSYVSKESRSAIHEATTDVYATGVRVAVKLYRMTGETEYLWRAFLFSEKNKEGMLWNNLMEGNAFANAGLPKSEKEELALLERSLKNTEEDLIYYENKSDRDRATVLKEELFALKLRRKEKLEFLREQYPMYYSLRYAPVEFRLEELKHKLIKEQSVLLEYFYDSDSLYLFSVTPNGIFLHQGILPESLEIQVRELREFDIVAFLSGETDIAVTYRKNLFSLYESLILPVEKEISDYKKIIIIPHGVLNYVAFETLCPKAETKDFRKLNYVIREWAVHYGWSAAVWLSTKFKKRNGEELFVGFAPVFKMSSNDIAFRSELTELPNAPVEVRRAASILEGDIYLAESATEATFRKVAPEASILHLATHALVNDAEPLQSGLAFYKSDTTTEDGFLRTYEIYNLDLKADLAVMNSCDSGHGKLAAGEGAISLGRAFYYAGCRSVMMSRWPVNDQSSAQLTQSLYHNLSAGVAKDVALQQAKLDYIHAADQLTGHPYFWGGLVVYGEVSEIVVEQFGWGLYFGLSVLLIVIVFSAIIYTRKE